jgi:glycosyltransferase involved in cell wall biosynthesis
LIGRRILYLVPDLYGPPGGIARHARIVCRALRAAGAAPTVLALHDPAPTRPEAPLAGITYRPCGGRRQAFALRAMRAAAAHPDLVLIEHAHLAPLGLAVARLAGAPAVVFAHGTEVWGRLGMVRRLALRRADRVLCASRVTADRALAANGLRRERLRVLNHCLDPDFAARVSQQEPRTPSLLTVARISVAERYKGHALVMRALPELLRTFPDLVYHVVGDGDGRPDLEGLAVQEGVGHAVRFHGFVPEDELPAHYAGASLFVMPSRGEGFGFVFLEAMAHGKPVVAGDGDAAAEFIRHEETGLLVDPENIAELAGTIARLLGNGELRLRMGTRAAEVVAGEFGFDTFQDRICGQLLEALEQRRRTGRRLEAGNLTGS